MTQPLVTVENLSKRYSLGHVHVDLLSERLAGLLRRGGRASASEVRKEFWALRDVSFEIQEGDVLGIIGRNGAGKSTLLKILSRLTAPTSGRAVIHGRIASLLEIGTGFHPELTGRENIYLNGTILGMRRREIDLRFDAIVAFSGVEAFLGTPVKRYSSGMYVRLAFAVAAHVEADVLIIDEVLAVGDAEFQKRCLGKMGEVARGGRTVLFVSHNLAALRALSTTALYLEEGSVVLTGSPDECIARYESNDDRRATGIAATPLTIAGVQVQLRGDQPGHQLDVMVTLRSSGPHDPAFLVIHIADPSGNPLMQAVPSLNPFVLEVREQVILVSIDLPALIPETYLTSVWVGNPSQGRLDSAQSAASFEIRSSPTPGRHGLPSKEHGLIVATATVRALSSTD